MRVGDNVLGRQRRGQEEGEGGKFFVFKFVNEKVTNVNLVTDKCHNNCYQKSKVNKAPEIMAIISIISRNTHKLFNLIPVILVNYFIYFKKFKKKERRKEREREKKEFRGNSKKRERKKIGS